MQPTIREASPPYVTFETKAVEDRQATIEQGRPMFKDVDFAYITPAGSKDRHEKIVVEWFEMLRTEVQNGRFPANWLEAYKAAYTAWKEDREIPVVGTSLKNWPVVTPAQVKTLLDLRVTTVEALAAANEETLNRIGMGARGLQQQARDFLAAAGDSGKLVHELNAVRQENERLQARNAKLEADFAGLQAQVNALTTAMSGKGLQVGVMAVTDTADDILS